MLASVKALCQAGQNTPKKSFWLILDDYQDLLFESLLQEACGDMAAMAIDKE